MSQNGFIFPKVRGENKNYLKPPPRQYIPLRKQPLFNLGIFRVGSTRSKEGPCSPNTDVQPSAGNDHQLLTIHHDFLPLPPSHWPWEEKDVLVIVDTISWYFLWYFMTSWQGIIYILGYWTCWKESKDVSAHVTLLNMKENCSKSVVPVTEGDFFMSKPDWRRH